MTAVKHHRVTQEESGQRLDNFLLRIWRGMPRSHVYRLLRSGQVRVNGRRARPSLRLGASDEIRLPPVRPPERNEPQRAPDALLERLERSVLYEDGQVIAVDKPAGLAVHGGSGQEYGLIECFRQLRSEKLELVHRLDRETSGILMLARNREALTSLHAALRDGELEKHYLLLVEGDWSADRLVDASLQRQRAGGQHGMVEDVEGKQAKTEFTVQQRFGAETLLRAQLLTGRMHQIRVHAAGQGHPLAGDRRYGNRDFNRDMRQHGLRRLFLHSAKLMIPASVLGYPLQLESALPQDLQQVLDRLEER